MRGQSFIDNGLSTRFVTRTNGLLRDRFTVTVPPAKEDIMNNIQQSPLKTSTHLRPSKLPLGLSIFLLSRRYTQEIDTQKLNASTTAPRAVKRAEIRLLRLAKDGTQTTEPCMACRREMWWKYTRWPMLCSTMAGIQAVFPSNFPSSTLVSL